MARPRIGQRAETAGAAFCAGEFSDRDTYVTTTEMALSTTTAMVGPGIAYAFARSPFVHASAVRQLHRLAPGRVFLGLGAGTGRMNRDWFAVESDRPAPRMAELIDVIKAYLHAENLQLRSRGRGACPPAVADVACVAAPGELGDDEVKVFVVAHADSDFEPLELIHFLIDRMPHFMVPRFVEVIDQLPKTASERARKHLLRDQGNSEKTWDREVHGAIKLGQRGIKQDQ